MITDNNIIIFNNDDEITDFCLQALPICLYDTTTNMPYYDYNYTPYYGNAIAKGINFTVKDPKSKVMKRGCVTRGIISKPLRNLVKM